MIVFTPFPVLETERIRLRKINLGDDLDLFEMRQNPSMIKYVDVVVDEDIAETRLYIDKMNKGIDENRWIIWAIESKQSKKVVGTISIWNINKELTTGELGYGLRPDHQGKGLMYEALKLVVDYGFQVMNLKTIEAYTEMGNLKSINLLERCHFIKVNQIDEMGRDQIYQMAVYQLLKQDKI
jgi:ribosomal-protein-alanine N-acetyltransferase